MSSVQVTHTRSVSQVTLPAQETCPPSYPHKKPVHQVTHTRSLSKQCPSYPHKKPVQVTRTRSLSKQLASIHHVPHGHAQQTCPKLHMHPLDSLHAGKGGFLHIIKTISLLHYHAVNSYCTLPPFVISSSHQISFIMSFVILFFLCNSVMHFMEHTNFYTKLMILLLSQNKSLGLDTGGGGGGGLWGLKTHPSNYLYSYPTTYYYAQCESKEKAPEPFFALTILTVP